MTVNVQGPAVFDDTNLVIQAAVNGVGLGLAFEEQVAALIMKRRLIRVLEDWCPPFPGFFLPEPPQSASCIDRTDQCPSSFESTLGARPKISINDVEVGVSDSCG